MGTQTLSSGIHEIQAPSLYSAEFGKNIALQFDNINRNFLFLANSDFLKGDDGKSINIVEIPLNDPKEPDAKVNPLSAIIKTAIKNAILTNCGAVTDEPEKLPDENHEVVKSVHVSMKNAEGIQTTQELKWDDFLNVDGAKVYLIKKDIDADTSKVQSSLAFIFLDSRFNTTGIYVDEDGKAADISTIFNNKVDTSCVLFANEEIVDEEGNSIYTFKAVNNWPNLYFDSSINDFCWKYQGVETKMPARGPKGKDAANVQNMFVVQVSSSGQSMRPIVNVMPCRNPNYTPDSPMDNSISPWVNISSYIKNYKQYGWPEITEGSTAVVFEGNGNTGSYGYWISIISDNNDDTGTHPFAVCCNSSTSINSIVNDNSFKLLLNSISPGSNSLKGLYLPISGQSTSSSNDPGVVHAMFTSTNNNNTQGLSNTNVATIKYGNISGFNEDYAAANKNEKSLSLNVLYYGMKEDEKGDYKSKLNIWDHALFFRGMNVYDDAKFLAASFMKLDATDTEVKNNLKTKEFECTLKGKFTNDLEIGTATVKSIIQPKEATYTSNGLATFNDTLHSLGTNILSLGTDFKTPKGNIFLGTTYLYGAGGYKGGTSEKDLEDVLNLNSIIAFGGSLVGQRTKDGGEIFNSYDGELLNHANDLYTHVEGCGNLAGKCWTHYIIGSDGQPKSDYSVFEEPGDLTYYYKDGRCAHAEGHNTLAQGPCTHAEGQGNIARAHNSHAEGTNNIAYGASSHVEGEQNRANGVNSHAEGLKTAAGGWKHKTSDSIKKTPPEEHEMASYEFTGVVSHAEGFETIAAGNYSHAEGHSTVALGDWSHALGYKSKSEGLYSHAEGLHSNAVGQSSHAEGNYTKALGDYSHAEGVQSVAYHTSGHAEGSVCKAESERAHAEGVETFATGRDSHAEGRYSVAATLFSHAEGFGSCAGYFQLNDKLNNGGDLKITKHPSKLSEKDGVTLSIIDLGSTWTLADYAPDGLETWQTPENPFWPIGRGQHAEGIYTLALGEAAHSEGYKTQALANFSHAEGILNIAYPDTVHSLGIGSEHPGVFYRKNAFEISKDGSMFVKGIGGYDGTNSHAEENPGKSLLDTLNKILENADTLTKKDDAVGRLFKSKLLSESGTILAENSIGETFNFYSENIAGGNYSHAEGFNTQTSRNAAHAEGTNTYAVSDSSHAEGSGCKAGAYILVGNLDDPVVPQKDGKLPPAPLGGYGITGKYSHAEGKDTWSLGHNSHAEGSNSKSLGESSHAEGENTIARGRYSHSEGNKSQSLGESSHAEGSGCKAGAWIVDGKIVNSANRPDGAAISGEFTHAEGLNTVAYGEASHAEGKACQAQGKASHAGGVSCRSIGNYSFAHGNECTASGDNSVVMGVNCKAIGYASVSVGSNNDVQGSTSFATGAGCYISPSISDAFAGGYHSKANKDASFAYGLYCESQNPGAVSLGYGNLTAEAYQCVVGRGNEPKNKMLFIVGNGPIDSTTNYSHRSNALEVSSTGDLWVASKVTSAGKDYAEMFEWEDGNKLQLDRVGYFVTLVDDKIKIALSSDDYILGIVSAIASVNGNNPMNWHDKYLKDDWGRILYEFDGTTPKLNPEYNPDQEYIRRDMRPEWSAIGLLGQLLVRQDGTLKSGGYCYPNDAGIATNTETGYKVLKIISKEIALVIFR